MLGWAHNTLCKSSALEIIAPTPQLEVPVNTRMVSVLFLQIYVLQLFTYVSVGFSKKNNPARQYGRVVKALDCSYHLNISI